MASEPRPMAPEDRELLERVADRVLELRMEVPALLTLETLTPVSLMAGQALVFFEPFVAAMLRLRDYRRFAALVERRETLALLIQMIEARADAAADRRDAARRKDRPADGPAPAPPGPGASGA